MFNFCTQRTFDKAIITLRTAMSKIVDFKILNKDCPLARRQDTSLPTTQSSIIGIRMINITLSPRATLSHAKRRLNFSAPRKLLLPYYFIIVYCRLDLFLLLYEEINLRMKNIFVVHKDFVQYPVIFYSFCQINCI